MTKFKSLLIISLIITLFIPVVETQAVSDNTNVYWSNGQQGSCWISFTDHDDVWLTPTGTETSPLLPGTVLENTDNTMTVNNNCVNGITVDAEPINISTPTGFNSSVLQDFEWKASTVNSQKFSLATGVDTYGTLPNIGNSTPVGSSDNPAKFDFSTNYKYTIDNQDIGGIYYITIQYTVSAN